jgi:hypothetical protein
MGHLPVVQLLVDRGAKIEAADKVDITFNLLNFPFLARFAV